MLSVREIALFRAGQAVEALPSPAAFDPTEVRRTLAGLLNPPLGGGPSVLRPVGTMRLGDYVVEKLELVVEPDLSLPALYIRAPPPAPTLVLATDSWPTRVSLLRARNAGLGVLAVAPRGTGATAWRETMLVNDNNLLGDPLLGQRAFDLARAREALTRRPEIDDRRIGLMAVGPLAGLSGLFAQALWPEFDAVFAGPLVGTVFESFLRTIPRMVHVDRLLQAGDIPHVAGLALGRPLSLVFDHGEYQRRYPVWASHLDRRASVRIARDVDLHRALTWLAAVLTLPSPPGCSQR